MKTYFNVLALLSVLLWLSCEKENKTDWTETADTIDTIAHESDDDYSYNENEINEITFNNTFISFTGSGAQITGTKITITDAGVYRITGNLNDGQIIIDSEDKNSIKLILNEVSLYCSNSAPVYIRNSSKTIIKLEENTINTLKDGSSYSYDDTENQEPNAVVFSKSDLTLYGTGKLVIDANGKDGISSKDGLIISGGVYLVNAVDNGIRGKDYLIIHNGNFNVTSGSNGLKSDNENSSSLGYINIEKGRFTISSAGDGITANTILQISGGYFNLISGGGSSHTATAVSSKGVKGLTSVSIACDTMIINSADDAIHSNFAVTVSKGWYSLMSGDDGVHADESLKIEGCTLSVLKSYEGIESFAIMLENCQLRVFASDDAINSTRGSRTEQDDKSNININCIYLYVNAASGDGIDSNGSITITGGTVVVHGPASGVNVGLDYNGTCKITGGTLILSGPNSNMVQAPSMSSTQNSVLIKFTGSYPANSIIHIEAADGTDILTFAPEHSFQSILFSSMNLIYGTYTIQTGGSSTGTITDGVYNGEYSLGIDYKSFTVSNVITTIGSSSGGSRP